MGASPAAWAQDTGAPTPPPLAQPRPPAPYASSPGAQAARFYQEGNAAFAQKRWTDAEAAYRKAWALSRTFDVAANLGEVMVRLEKWRETAALLAFGLRSAPPSAKPAQRDRTRHFLDETLEKVGALRLRPSVEGAEVLVDGEQIRPDDLADAVFVLPGAHQIIARKQGFREANETIVAAPGSSQDVSLTLVPAPVTPPSAPAAGTTPSPGSALTVTLGADATPGTQRSLLPAFVLGGAAVAGIGLGIGLTVTSNATSADADQVRGKILSEGGQCVSPGAFADPCDELASALDRVDTLGNGARVAFVAGGALALGAAAYVLWPVLLGRGSAETRTQGQPAPLQWAPLLGRNQAGVAVLGGW